MPKLILKINAQTDEVYTHPDICCYLLNTALPETYIKNFDRRGALLLLGGDNAAGLCKSLNADGVVVDIDSSLPVKKQVASARAQLGSGKVFGAVIEPSRHQAMLVSETEPDFVAFRFGANEASRALPVVRWYNELFLIQSALDMSGGFGEWESFAPDFLIINSSDYKDFGC